MNYKVKVLNSVTKTNLIIDKAKVGKIMVES